MISASPTLATALAPVVSAAASAPSGPDAGTADRNAFSLELQRATGAPPSDDRTPAPAATPGPATRARKPEPRGRAERAPGSDAAGRDAGAAHARMAPKSESAAIAAAAAGEREARVDEHPAEAPATEAPAADLAAFVAGLAAPVPPAASAHASHRPREGAQSRRSPTAGAKMPAAADVQSPREAAIARVHEPGHGSQGARRLDRGAVAEDDAPGSSQDAVVPPDPQALPTQRTGDTPGTDAAAPALAPANAAGDGPAAAMAVAAMAPGGSAAPAVGRSELASAAPAAGIAAGDRPAAASPVAAMAPGALEDSPALAVGLREVAPALGARVDAFTHGRPGQARLRDHGAGIVPPELPPALEAARLRTDAGAQATALGRVAAAALSEAAALAPDVAAPSPLASGTVDPAAPHSVVEDTLAQAVGTREFAPALGARIAVFARNGVEHAQLGVHPADMGPIVVQLVLDGSRVRVDFAAEIGATRQLLEQSLPVLASALQEAGFTLTGGGVFPQARDGGERGSTGPFPPAAGVRARLADAGADGAAAMTPRVVRRAGLVDLYA